VLAALVLEDVAHLLQQRVAPRIELERHAPGHERWVFRVVRRGALLETHDELLDIAQVLAPCASEPLAFGRAGHHARELARRGVRQMAVAQRRLELGQLAQLLRDAEPILRRSRRIPEHVFEVLLSTGDYADIVKPPSVNDIASGTA